MREEGIAIQPFEQMRIDTYEGQKQVNEHAYVRLAGMIPFDKKEEYEKLGREEAWVQVIAATEEGTCILFYGVTTEMRLEVANGTCRMELVLRSGSSLMDKARRVRSFQSEKLTYADLLETCGQGTMKAVKIMTEAKGKETGQFLMQYMETDWEFIKRLASMNGTVVVADCSTKGKKYYFGLPERKAVALEDAVEYKTQCDMEEYRQKKARGMEITPADTTSYLWESREIYELGDWGMLGGQKLVIWKIETRMKGSMLYHIYDMRPMPGLPEPAWHNPYISGVTLFGRVRDVSGEKVQIEISGDENKENAGACWFTYATVYSSADGTGWYCMPELGDQVRLHFPTEKETEAYVASAYHEEKAELRKNPEVKFWRNKEGKEIRLAPGNILLTNNNGTYIELSDSDGVKIVSEGSVSLRAGGSLNISSSNSSIVLSAPKKIRLKQGDTEMNLGGDVNLSGAQIKL